MGAMWIAGCRCGLKRTESGSKIEVFFEKEFFVAGLQGADIVLGKTSALQTYQIEPTGLTWIAIDDHERRNVLNDFRTAADDRVLANTTKLMNGGQARNNGVVAYFDMSRERTVIRENHMVADLAVMRYVSIAKKQIVRTDACRDFVMGTSVDGGIFSKNVMRPNQQMSRLANVFQILRLATDGGERKKFIIFADPRRTFDHDVRMQRAIVTDDDIITDDTKRPHLDILTQCGAG